MNGIVPLVCAAAVAACTVERAEVRRPPRSRAVVSTEDSANVRGTVLTLGREFEAGDLAGLERLFDPDVVVFESGRVNRGWADYRDHHLAPELAALSERRLEFSNIEMRILGAMAWVTFGYRVSARAGTGPVGADGVGTAVLERAGGLWRITHLHLSAAPDSPASR